MTHTVDLTPLMLRSFYLLQNSTIPNTVVLT
ncbi:UNVERIFIED_ORG: hypothetical protein J3D58_001943 [Paenarthrobacter nicotinovorans]